MKTNMKNKAFLWYALIEILLIACAVKSALFDHEYLLAVCIFILIELRDISGYLKHSNARGKRNE